MSYCRRAEEAALLLEIARCPRVGRALENSNDACHGVANEQRGVARQVPEPWSGRLSAPILFLSSNPSISDSADDTAEKYPTTEWSDERIERFFAGRFEGEDAPVLDGRYHLQRNGKYSSTPTRFWCSVRRRAAELLDREPEPGMDYALGEIVHCKSRAERGVRAAAETCAELYLGRVLAASDARAVVCLGAFAREAVAKHLGLENLGRHVPPDGERSFHLCFLPHPNARGGKKTFDEVTLEAVRAALAVD